MKWTTDKPTDAGWYWCRPSSRYPWEVVQVLESDTGLTFMLVNEEGERALKDLKWAYEWAGPIPEPEES